MNRMCVVVALCLFAASPAWAQSLGAVAKKEEARRKEVKKPSKVYTNEDLKRFGPPPPASQPAVSPTTPPAAQPAAAGQPGAAKEETRAETEKDPAKDEAWWRNRLGEARAALERNRLFLEALQSRANALLADFTARDDPAQRAQIADERAKTLAELQRVKEEIASQTKAIADIEEEARKSGVPPGWLR